MIAYRQCTISGMTSQRVKKSLFKVNDINTRLKSVEKEIKGRILFNP